MERRGMLRPRDLLAIIVIVVGCLGFLLLGIGISSIGNSTLIWLGGWTIALVGLIVSFLSKWLK